MTTANPNPTISPHEFAQYLETEYQSWASRRDRPLIVHLSSLEEWCERQYWRIRKQEQEVAK